MPKTRKNKQLRKTKFRRRKALRKTTKRKKTTKKGGIGWLSNVFNLNGFREKQEKQEEERNIPTVTANPINSVVAIPLRPTNIVTARNVHAKSTFVHKTATIPNKTTGS
mgnify:CR=1 FL=1